MKKFLLLNQDEEPMIEIEYENFSVGIIELVNGLFAVNVVPHKDKRNFLVAIYRDVEEAAAAVQQLRDFAFAVVEDNQGFAMPVSEDPVTALEILDLLL